MKMKKFLTAVLYIALANLQAQDQMTTNTPAVKSVGGIVKEVLQIISGEERKIGNWDAFRNLFLHMDHRFQWR